MRRGWGNLQLALQLIVVQPLPNLPPSQRNPHIFRPVTQVVEGVSAPNRLQSHHSKVGGGAHETRKADLILPTAA